MPNNWPERGYLANGLSRYIQSVKGIGKVAGNNFGHAGEQAGVTGVREVYDLAVEMYPKFENSLRDFLLKPYKEGGSAPWLHESILFALSVGLNIRDSRTVSFDYMGGSFRRVVLEDPYTPLFESSGIGWKKVDLLRERIGFSERSHIRIRGAILYALRDMAMTDGHTCCDKMKLINYVHSVLEVDVEASALIEEVNYLRKKGILVVENRHLFLRRYWVAEKNAAQAIGKMIHDGENNQKRIDVDTAGLSADQVEAIEGIVSNPFSILTGGPGTGKTHTISRLVSAALFQGMDVRVCALAGRAAGRLAEMAEADAYTIHRILGYGGIIPEPWDEEAYYFPGTKVHHNGAQYRAVSESQGVEPPDRVWQKRKTKLGVHRAPELPADLLVVDELSMIGIELLSQLLKAAAKKRCKVVLVGDVDQLPPVEAGFPFRDLMLSEGAPFYRLTEIHRQKDDSIIPVRAAALREGHFPLDEMKGMESAKEGCMFIPVAKDKDESDVASQLVDMMLGRIPKFYGCSLYDVQVLVPVNEKGSMSCDAINKMVQKKRGFTQMYNVGDRIIVTLNNYSNALWNGDIGVVKEIIESDRFGKPRALTVAFSRAGTMKIKLYGGEERTHIALAWAITIHKAQGSEFDVCIVPISKSVDYHLHRRLLYTALTRAKRAVLVVGERNLIHKVVRRKPDDARITSLRGRIEPIFA